MHTTWWVLNQPCQQLGYQGLLLIFDEPNMSVDSARSEANNLFEILSRCAHVPVPDDPPPVRNDHGYASVLDTGPHFGLAVGITEGDTFADPDIPLRDARAFLRSEDDAEFLKPPEPAHHKEWLRGFLDLVRTHFQFG
jgi:hypothetical protein